MSDHKSKLLEKISSRTARVGVIGLGYVGLPLALLFEEAPSVLNVVGTTMRRRSTSHPVETETRTVIQRMKKAEREAFLEDLLAAASPDYLASIRKARAQYRARRTRTWNEVFAR
jgi:UDP-N-acetyl-D-mannosaminuronate dehydrogenase